MKLAKETRNKVQKKSQSVFKLSILSGLIASSLLVGCNSMGQKSDGSSDPVVSAKTTSTTSAEVDANIKNKQESSVAPVTESSKTVKKAIAQVPKKNTPKPAAKTDVVTSKAELVETKVATVKEEGVEVVKESKAKAIVAAPVVEAKSVEKTVVEVSKAEKVIVPPKVAVTKVPAKRASSKKRNSKGKALNIRLKDLPVTHDIWQFKQGDSALEQGVVVSTPTWEMGKESYNSQIWVTLMENQILINSSSDIDSSAGALGVKINNGSLIPFSRIEDNNIGVLEGEWLDELQNGGKMDIYLGFFPGKKPRSAVFKTNLSLDSLSRVVPTYRKLLQ